MKLSEIKMHLSGIDKVTFKLTTGNYVPIHFHVTEISLLTKYSIDCGGRMHQDKMVAFQLWDANDQEHRLGPRKLLNIIAKAEKVLNLQDYEIEVEYQSDTIGRYDIGFDGREFVLLPKHTSCLASDSCGLPQLLESEVGCCSPGSNCC